MASPAGSRPMFLNEADVRAKLIDPALHAKGWSEDLIRREETAGPVRMIGGKVSRSAKGRVDYTLRLPPGSGGQRIAVALIEAKAERYPPAHGLEQAKQYAAAGSRLNVPFVYSSNGHQFVEYDASTKLTHGPAPIADFPSPDELCLRYEAIKGFSLDSPVAKPLSQAYSGGEGQRRYYQDAAIRAALEKVAAGKNRALISMATGSGKTFVAVQLLKKISDAGQLRRALFLCDRHELRTQALIALQDVFGDNAGAASSTNPAVNARIIVATYQTLGVANDDDDASFLRTHYPEDHFSHIIIDEAHRSAWGKWSEVLRRNDRAVHIGLTATPREFDYEDMEGEYFDDLHIRRDNIKYFGEPVYEYSIGQGIEDGYLAFMQILRQNIFLNDYLEKEAITGLARSDLEDKQLKDALTGETVAVEEARTKYDSTSFEASLLIPDRVEEMCGHLFKRLLETGAPEQKTIIFCASDSHAENVAICMNNLYAQWSREQGRQPVSDYAFKCTAASSGNDFLPDFRGGRNHHFIATTVDLLTTGVDVPCVQNIVFFRYVNSPIAFHQMVGRGTRLDTVSGKLMFRVFDYTDATRLFGEETKTAYTPTSPPGDMPDAPDISEHGDPQRQIVLHGLDVRISDAGACVMTTDDEGRAVPVTLEEYRNRLAASLVENIPALDDFRETWVNPSERQEMMDKLPDSGLAPYVVRDLEEKDEYDLFDVLVEVGYGQAPKTRIQRADAFGYKNGEWLSTLPERTQGAVLAIASQFSKGGTDDLESHLLFRTPEVSAAGGIGALREYGAPADTVNETKRRMFIA